jgi:hypothetical protein
MRLIKTTGSALKIRQHGVAVKKVSARFKGEILGIFSMNNIKVYVKAAEKIKILFFFLIKLSLSYERLEMLRHHLPRNLFVFVVHFHHF